MEIVRVGIIGATGYTGEESIKILLKHKHVKLTELTALPEECGPIDKIFPALKGRIDLTVRPLDIDDFAKNVDIALCCLPHKVSMGYVPKLLDKGLKVIDFSADYRLKNVELYEKYYTKHTDRENISKAVYGLPELFREKIKLANLIANPGCFPTSVILGLAPLIKENLIEPTDIIANSTTGVSGAGRKPNINFHFPEMNEDMFAYAVGGVHRHSPEINEICSEFAQEEINVLFQPAVVSIDRGILSVIYTKPKRKITQDELNEIYRSFYKNEPFIRILDTSPKLKAVAYTNFCDTYPATTINGDRIIIFSAIDNLIKGASGQAIQNLNIICGFDETEGLL